MMKLPDTETLLLNHLEGRLYVTFNRPERRNAMNNQMSQELHSVADFLLKEDSIRVVILQGAGGHFCAGGDIKERKEQTDTRAKHTDPAKERNIKSGHLFKKFWSLPQTLIVVVEGSAMGGGFGLACLADLTLVDKHAKLGMPETTLGIAPAQIAPYVVKRIGLTRAKQMALTGERVNGEKAYQLGIAQYLAESAEGLQELLESVIQQVERCGPKACAATKEIMHEVGHHTGDDMIEFSANIFSKLNKQDEGREGHRAFVEKRKPIWTADK
ncbi:MAG: enoyl-CoA hydratase/isomerase family protein [Cycloclasticus sp.]|nr:enoyl-CoA hydratase/isomerase family protein [Cycloclasticus sp.]